jgi:hypothetical protein
MGTTNLKSEKDILSELQLWTLPSTLGRFWYSLQSKREHLMYEPCLVICMWHGMKIKVKLSLCLTKHNDKKADGDWH